MNQSLEYKSRFIRKISMIVSALLAGVTISYAAPSGGVVTSGTANISQNGNTTNINQSTQKATINWQKFGIKANETVNFKQPNSSSITLNRVIGNEKSVINGALNANGQVWILNSNGVLFGKNASINTAGLLATTAKLSDNDFNIGNYNFKNSSSNSVINLGTINISNEAYAVLAGKEVTNEGSIKAVKGKIHLVGADEYSINLNGNSLLNLTVKKGILDSIVKNSGSIKADGGEIYLTTNAVNELLKGVVNNTGVIEADSLNGLTGKVELFAHGGEAQVGGTISATDGFVETSGKDFTIDKNTNIKAKTWLIDPTNLTVSDATAYETALQNGTDTSIQTDNATGSDEGNIYINDTITWNTTAKLTLNAYNDIFINSNINAKSDGKLALYYGQGSNDGGNSDYHINAPVNLSAGDNFFTKKGSAGSEITWKVITDLGSAGSTTGTDLQGMQGNLSGHYVLGSNIDASDTKNWDSGKGFNPIGNGSNRFTGSFDGLGHTIDSLYINRSSQDGVGLFGYTRNSTIQNVGLTNINITGTDYVGGLVGYNYNFEGTSTISNSYASGSVKGRYSIGGLLGNNYNIDGNSTISNSYASGSVKGNYYVGGLVGENDSTNSNSTVENSYASGSVSSESGNYVGGLVGKNHKSNISNSYASGSVSSESGNYVGGLVGKNSSYSTITNSFYNKETSSQINGIGEDENNQTVTGLTTAQMQDINTFKDAGWDIKLDETLPKNNYPILVTKDGVTTWVIGKYVSTPNNTNTNANTNNTNIQKIITTIDNKTSTQYNLPKKVAFKNSSLTTTTANKSNNFIASAVETNTNKKLASLSEIQEQTGSSEVRIPLSENSIITLVNNAVNLPSGVEEQFYINDNKK